MLLDLNSLASIRQFTSDLTLELTQLSEGRGAQLDLLINNAGVTAQFPIELTHDGVERTFQANYFGHFALTQLLLPLLKQAVRNGGARARVVHLTSGAHRGAPAAGVPLSLAGVNDENLGAYARYGMAKLANLVFARELARRHGDALVSHAVHPGVVASEMLRLNNFKAMLGPFVGGFAWRLAQARNAMLAYSTKQAALSVLYAAMAPELANGEWPLSNGQLFVPVATPWEPRHPMATDVEFGMHLWDFTFELFSQRDTMAGIRWPAGDADETRLRPLRSDPCGGLCDAAIMSQAHAMPPLPLPPPAAPTG